jgi:hypothetical protein
MDWNDINGSTENIVLGTAAILILVSLYFRDQWNDYYRGVDLRVALRSCRRGRTNASDPDPVAMKTRLPSFN